MIAWNQRAGANGTAILDFTQGQEAILLAAFSQNLFMVWTSKPQCVSARTNPIRLNRQNCSDSAPAGNDYLFSSLVPLSSESFNPELPRHILKK